MVTALEREARTLARALAAAALLACEGDRCASSIRELATLGEGTAASPGWAFRGVRRQADLAMAPRGASVAVFDRSNPRVTVGLVCTRGLAREDEAEIGCGLFLDVDRRRIEFTQDPDHSSESLRDGAASITVDRQGAVILPGAALRIRAR